MLQNAFGDFKGLKLRGLYISRTESRYTKKDTGVGMVREEHFISDLENQWKVMRFFEAARYDQEKVVYDMNTLVEVDVESLKNGEIFGTISEYQG